ncbi:hypothetical protein ONZ45_g7263 [Pleurotus djamor]|nr:hypothetical protein ONZ45_g18915 [Pleurotus djamor]KAJ8515283.1 hypothetical protein ONZ45_g7263 [Pleurotus djamor]
MKHLVFKQHLNSLKSDKHLKSINMYMHIANIFAVAMVIIGAVASPSPDPKPVNDGSDIPRAALCSLAGGC